MARKNNSKYNHRPLKLTVDKLKKEQQNVSGRKQLNTSLLRSNQPYQRPVQEADVMRIVNNFNPLMLDDIIVSFRDGMYYIVDGQHRTSALKRIHHGDCMVWCKVLSNLSYTEEAELYNRFNSSRKKLNYNDTVRAHVEAKDNPELNDIKHIVENAGFILNTAKGGGRTGQISCLKASVNAYRLLGRNDFEWMLLIISRLWGGQKNNTHQNIISGLSLFLNVYRELIDEATFIKRLEHTTPQQIIDAAKSDHSTRNADIRLAKQFLVQYNGNRKSRDILPYRFNG